MDINAIALVVLGSGGFWAVVSAIVAAWLDRRREKKDTVVKSIAENSVMLEGHGKALRGLLYGELERRCTYYLKAGKITAAELNDLRKYYYEPYHDTLGGDGTIEGLFHRVEQLPVD